MPTFREDVEESIRWARETANNHTHPEVLKRTAQAISAGIRAKEAVTSAHADAWAVLAEVAALEAHTLAHILPGSKRFQ